MDRSCSGSESEVTPSCPILCSPIDCSLPGFSIHGIFQARVLEWVAISFSRGIFLTQGLNPGLLPCRQILYRLSQQGSPRRGREGSKNVHLLFVHPTHHREAVTVASRPERVTMPERKVSGTRRVWCGDSRAVDPATTLRRSHV